MGRPDLGTGEKVPKHPDDGGGFAVGKDLVVYQTSVTSAATPV